jgi:hypothetical protein
MCSEKSIEKAKNGQAIIISKVNLFIILITLFAGILFSYANLKFQANDNCQQIQKLEKKIETIHIIDTRLSRIEGIIGEMNKKLDNLH